jgi:hypothetical protein
MKMDTDGNILPTIREMNSKEYDEENAFWLNAKKVEVKGIKDMSEEFIDGIPIDPLEAHSFDIPEVDEYQPEDLKFIYTESELVNLPKEELLKIISLQTSDDIIIYFDQMVTIEPNEVVLTSGERIPISSFEKYLEINNLFSRYKLFKVMHDPEGTLDALQRASDLLENMIVSKMNNLETLITQNSQRMVDKFEIEIVNIRDSVLNQIEPSAVNLQNTAKRADERLGQVITNVKRKLDKIDTTELNTTIEKLNKISNLLGEVVL